MSYALIVAEVRRGRSRRGTSMPSVSALFSKRIAFFLFPRVIMR